MEDREIINLYLARSETAVEETSRRYSAMCRSLAFGILRDHGDAEEITNDVLQKVWDAIPPAKPQKLSAFIAAITRNLSINRLKAQTAEKRGGGVYLSAIDELAECVADPRDAYERAVESGMITQALNKFLASAAKRNRVIFMQRYWYLRELGDIAAEQGMTENAVTAVL